MSGEPRPASDLNTETTQLGGDAAGFWSYVWADDEADTGRILGLASALQAQFEMLTAKRLELFVDRDSIKWGEEWEGRIQEAIAGTTFFIPIVTPRYFASAACRKELIQFAGKASHLGLEELLLPVLYVSVPELDAEEPEDELAQLIKKREWIDWRDHRLADSAESAVRQAVHAMATRLVEISARVAEVPDQASSDNDAQLSADDNDEPGLVDILATGEDALPDMVQAVEALGAEIAAVGGIMEAAAGEVEKADSRGGGFALRLQIARRVAGQLEPRADSIEKHGRQFGTALVAADPAVRALLTGVREQLKSDDHLDAQTKDDVLINVRSVIQLGDETEEGIGHLRGFLKQLSQVATLSRDIKRPVSRIEKGLQGMVDGQAVIEEWALRAREVERDLSGVSRDE